MSTLLPGFGDQLAVRAEQLAAQRSRPRRHWRASGIALLALLSASGVAYASKGLWNPQLGDDHRGVGTVTASEVPPLQSRLFGVLRREQTAADRGEASRYALRLSGSGGQVVRTNSVRLLSKGTHGEAAVLIPLASAGDSLMRKGQSDLLCLWLRDPIDGGGFTCGTTTEAMRGLSMSMVSPPRLTPAQKARMARYMAAEEKRAKAEHRTYLRLPGSISHPGGDDGATHAAGFVPDGVAMVRFGDKKPRLVPVHDNFYEADWPSGQHGGNPVWLDAQGKRFHLRGYLKTMDISVPPVSGIPGSVPGGP